MSDIAMCHGEGVRRVKEEGYHRIQKTGEDICPKRDSCRRYTAPWSAYQTVQLRENTANCDDYVDDRGWKKVNYER